MKYGGQYGIGLGGGRRNGMNNSERGRRNCGLEGLDTSAIVKKRQSLGLEQSLNEAWNSTTSYLCHTVRLRIPVFTHTYTINYGTYFCILEYLIKSL